MTYTQIKVPGQVYNPAYRKCIRCGRIIGESEPATYKLWNGYPYWLCNNPEVSPSCWEKKSDRHLYVPYISEEAC